MSSRRLTFRLLALPALLVAAAAHADDTVVSARAKEGAPVRPTARPSPTGFYPLWEDTGVVRDFGTFSIGWQRAQVGLGMVQLATRPSLALYGTLAAEAKLRLWRTARTAAALTVAGYRVPTAAESRGVGNLSARGFTNPYGPAYLVPIAFSKTWFAAERLAVHWASTALIALGEDEAHRNLSFGQTLFAELFASAHWAARVHLGVEGIRVEPRARAGLSFAYAGEAVDFAFGGFRKITFKGEQANEVQFDVALRFD